MDIRKRISLEVARNLRKEEVAGHPLKQLFWECTLRCNFACRHCGSDCKVSSATPDMPFKDFRAVLSEIAANTDPHKVMVIITGGEPLMRPDLEACGLEIYKMGFPWGMVTNGWSLTPEKFRGLLRSGLHSLTISLDGLKDNHDWMRGRVGTFERATAAIRMICDYNAACMTDNGSALGFHNLKKTDMVNFDVVTCVNRRSYKELPSIKEHLISLGLKKWRLFTIFPSGRAANDPELQLTPEELRGLMDFIKETRKEGRIHPNYACEGFLADYEGEVRDNYYFCHAGVNIGSILADGSISACASIRSDYHQGNIYRGDSFWKTWNEGFSPYRDRSWMKNGECSKCRFWRYCEGGAFHLRDASGLATICRTKDLSIRPVSE